MNLLLRVYTLMVKIRWFASLRKCYYPALYMNMQIIQYYGIFQRCIAC